jgi:hypothetical protein
MTWDEFNRAFAPVPGGEFYEVDGVCYGHNEMPIGVPDERLWEVVEVPVNEEDEDGDTLSVIQVFPYQHRHAIGAIECGGCRIGFIVTNVAHEFNCTDCVED